jgi:hypothetical protein
MASNLLTTCIMLVSWKGDQIMHVQVRPSRQSLTFGEFVEAAYRTWGKRRAKGVIKLAVEAQVIKFCGRQRFVIS